MLFVLSADVSNGQPRANYVSLGQWARANVFSVRWLERDKTVELTGKGARLTFNVDSRSDARKAQINGVLPRALMFREMLQCDQRLLEVLHCCSVR